MKIAICDNELKAREEIKELLSVYFEKKLLNFELHNYDCGEDLLVSNIKFDLVFLRVKKSEINSIETGRKLKIQYPNIIIFIITEHSEYLDEAFELGAYRFFENPIDINRLYCALDSAILHIYKNHIKIICSNKTKIIPLTSIVYCEAYNRKTKIITTEGDFVSKEHISFWKNQLDKFNFYSPHTSFIVNFNYVESFNRRVIYVSYCGKTNEIAIAPKRQCEFKKKFQVFYESVE